MAAVECGCHTHDEVRNYVAENGHELWADHDAVGGKLRTMAAQGLLTFERRQMTYSWYGVEKGTGND